MSERYTGSQVSKDVRPAQDLTPVSPVPPGFARDEWEGFKLSVKRAFDSKLLPDSYKTVEAAIVGALKGRELGLDPLYALSVIYLIGNKPGLEGEAMLGLVLRRYPNAHVKWVKATHAEAVLELARPGGQPSTFTFTIQDALRAGLVTKINPDGTVQAAHGKSSWAQYTRKMLCWRAISEGVTLLFPECVQGCLTPDELTPPKPTPRGATAAEIEAAIAPALEPVKDIVNETPAPQTAETLDAEFTETPAPQAQKKVDPPQKPVETAPTTTGKNSEYVFPVGQFFGKTIGSLPEAQLRAYYQNLKMRSQRDSDPQILEMMQKVKEFLG